MPQLRRECGENLPVGRFGGDQFAAAVTVEPVAAAERMLGAVAGELGLSASIGVAVAGNDGAYDSAELLDRALRAARAAKLAGGRRAATA